jgi:iron complex transport system ATP-binding protein
MPTKANLETSVSALSARDLVIDIPGRADGSALNFSMQAGQVWAVLGPNGAGKTTLLHTLAGLRPPRSGEVQLGARPLAGCSRKAVAQELAVVFQHARDSFPATVLETALIGRHPYHSRWDFDTPEDMQLAVKALASLDLAGLEQRLTSTLSGGERQRLAIATALVQQPCFWLMDEPTNHLDLHHQVAVMKLVRAQAQAGCGVLLCLHDINLAARWCSHVLLLYPDGNACWGEVADMLSPPALEVLYSQPLLSTEVDGQRLFVPRI